MANKTVSAATNLLQRLAIALGEGGVDAKVEYVPRSNEPYVRLAMDGGFDAAEALRNRVLVALAEKGFRRRGDATVVQPSERGFLHVDVGSPQYDPVRGKAVLDLSASGPYAANVAIDERTRDVPAERARFVAAERQAEHEAWLRWMATESLLRTMIQAAPFTVPAGDARAILDSRSMAVASRVVRAFASQSLSGMDDLVEKAGLHDLLDRPGASPGPRP